MKRTMVVVLILAIVLLCGGCASTGDKNKSVTSAPGDEEYAPPASDESADDGANGIAEAAAQVRTVMKKAVDETAVAAKKSVKDLDKTTKKFRKAAADEVAGDLTSLKNTVVDAVKGKNGKGAFPWWIIILIIILIILLIYFSSRGKTKPQG